MSIPQEVIDEVQNRIDIVELISSYIPLKQAGRNFKALCPFHSEKTPSFFVSPHRQIFHCFGCGVGGGVFQFVMQYEKVSFPEAVEILANKAGITIPKGSSDRDSLRATLYRINKEAALYFRKILLSEEGKLARTYLLKRGLDLKTIDIFKIGYAPQGIRNLFGYMRKKGISIELLEKVGLLRVNSEGSFIDLFRDRLIFPILDIKGRVIGFGGRRLRDREEIPKYVNSPESTLYHKGSYLYGLNLSREAILKEDSCIVVEGYLDMILPYQAGFKNIVACLGTALTPLQVRLIKRYTRNVLFLFDSDEAGRSSLLRSLDLVIEEDLNPKVVELPWGYDPDRMIRENKKDELYRLLSQPEDFFSYKFRVLRQRFNLDEPHQKFMFLEELLLTLEKIPHQVIKYEYIKKLSEWLNIKEEFLLQELKSIRKKSLKSVRDKVFLEEKKVPSYGAEEYVLKCSLFDGRICALIKKALTVEDFQDPVFKKIFSICVTQEEKFSFKDVVNYTEDDEVISRITEMGLDNFEINQELLKESILKIKSTLYKKKREFLSRQIKEAEEEGDRIRLKKLVSDYQQLLKEEEALR